MDESQDLRISVQCVDDPEGHPGVIVDDAETFSFSSRQDAIPETEYDGLRPDSTVRVFQPACYEDGNV